MAFTKTMRPDDCVKYCSVTAEVIRSALINKVVDFGFAVNVSGGQRWTYIIIPQKFFAYIGQEVPEEWRVQF